MEGRNGTVTKSTADIARPLQVRIDMERPTSTVESGGQAYIVDSGPRRYSISVDILGGDTVTTLAGDVIPDTFARSTRPATPDEMVPVVRCDDAAIERAAVLLFARSFIPMRTVEEVRYLWDAMEDEAREFKLEAARELFRAAAGETA